MTIYVIVHDYREWPDDAAKVVAAYSDRERAIEAAETYVEGVLDPENDAELPYHLRNPPESHLRDNGWTWYRGLTEEGSAVCVAECELDAPFAPTPDPAGQATPAE